MTNKEVNQIKVESTKKSLDYYVEQLVKTTERVLFYKHQWNILREKSKLSEDEKKKKQEYEANITHYTEGIEELEVHIEILRRMMEAFENNKPVEL